MASVSPLAGVAARPDVTSSPDGAAPAGAASCFCPCRSSDLSVSRAVAQIVNVNNLGVKCLQPSCDIGFTLDLLSV
jgi:hypothetical protein